jgi:hypothetical protein
MESNLEVLQKGARDEYNSMLFSFTIEGAHSYLDSLTRKAYLQGIRDAKGCVPAEFKFPKRGVHKDLNELSDWILKDAAKNGSNQCRTSTLEAITRLEESV